MKGNKHKMKHTTESLRQMQSVPLEGKIIMSQLRIQQWYDHWGGDVYVSFSGGKDSTVLKHLVETTSGVHDVPSVFVDTGLEYPEVRMFATKNADVVLRPEMRFDEVIEKYGYPVISKEISKKVKDGKLALQKGNTESYALKQFNGTYLNKNGEVSLYAKNCEKWKFLLDAPFKISHQCCDVMKKRPVKKYSKESGRKPYIATMVHESLLRKQTWLKNGCNAFNKNNPSSQPMAFWTEQDVLEYIVKFNLDYAKVYGDIVFEDGKYRTTGVDRTGCMFCMLGCHLEKEPNRFQKMKETHPRQYEFCMNKLGLKDVLDYINVSYE